MSQCNNYNSRKDTLTKPKIKSKDPTSKKIKNQGSFCQTKEEYTVSWEFITERENDKNTDESKSLDVTINPTTESYIRNFKVKKTGQFIFSQSYKDWLFDHSLKDADFDDGGIIAGGLILLTIVPVFHFLYLKDIFN
eukprot:339240_1